MVDSIPNQDIQFPQEQEITFNLLDTVSVAVQKLNNKKICAEREIDNKIAELKKD